ncbi:hypothetical protein DAPPUDRAFT_65109, partial [Daphnia pulex]
KECACAYTLQIPLGSLVEVILIDEGMTFDATHPFHLHGYSFRVVAMERIGSNVTVDQIRAMDDNGLIRRNLVDAPIKDTVAIPDGGYTAIRFLATNPGYWLLHCHLEFHAEVGMGAIFEIGEHEDFPPIPDNFPTCGDWFPSEKKTVDVNFTVPKYPIIYDIIPIPAGENELLPLLIAASPLIHPHESREMSHEISVASSFHRYYSLALYTAYCLSIFCFHL